MTARNGSSALALFGLLAVEAGAAMPSAGQSAGTDALAPVRGSSSMLERDGDVGRWSVFAYGGAWSDSRLAQILLLQVDFQRSNVWVVGASRTLQRVQENALLEVEGNVARHTGMQDHYELNAALTLRWTRSPWDRYVDSTFAFGIGPSYASNAPEIEKDDDRGVSRYHVYLVTEMTFAPREPNGRDWELLMRVHHRSGMWGVVSDAPGSNFPSIGLRFHFD